MVDEPTRIWAAVEWAPSRTLSAWTKTLQMIISMPLRRYLRLSLSARKAGQRTIRTAKTDAAAPEPKA